MAADAGPGQRFVIDSVGVARAETGLAIERAHTVTGMTARALPVLADHVQAR